MSMTACKMKKFNIDGFYVGLIISALANLISFQELQISNVLLGGLLGILTFKIFGINP